MAELFRPVRFLWFPLLLIATYTGLSPQLSSLDGPVLQLLPWLPWLLSAMTALLGWHFQSSRAVLITLLLLLTTYWLQSEPSHATLWRDLLLGLLPLNLALIGYFSERPLLSQATLWRVLIIALQPALILLMLEYYPSQLSQALQLQPPALELLPFPLPWPFTVILCQLVATALLISQMATRQQLFDSYLLVTAVIISGLISQPLTLQHQQILLSLALLLWMTALLIYGRNLAYMDDLTGLPGRRALNQRLLNLGRRHSLAMLDIDHFKKFNDTHGHDVGDQVLQLVASRLRQVGGGGTAYRYGGEEFCIVFAGKRVEQTLAALEEVRSNVAAAQLQLRSGQRPRNDKEGKKMRGSSSAGSRSVSVTISIGVAQRQPDSNTLKEADKALYKAKKQGRNRICQ